MGDTVEITQERFKKSFDEGIIYDDLKDKNIARRFVYTKSNPDGTITDTPVFYAYADKDCTIRMSADELFEAFVKNFVVVLFGTNICTISGFASTTTDKPYANTYLITPDATILVVSSEAMVQS